MKPSVRWPLAIVGIIVVHVAALVGLVAVATGDPSHYVEEDYYRKALRWDEHMAQERRNAELGWAAAVSLRGEGPRGATLEVRLVNRLGEPLAGARVSVETYAIARAGERIRAALPERAPGRYAMRLPMARRGRWEVRLEATRGGARFTHVAVVERMTAGRSPAWGAAR